MMGAVILLVGAVAMSLVGFYVTWRLWRPTPEQLIVKELNEFRNHLVYWIGSDSTLILIGVIFGVLKLNDLFVGLWAALVFANIWFLLRLVRNGEGLMKALPLAITLMRQAEATGAEPST